MAQIVLTDGGMGQELLRRSSNKDPRRWSAEYLLSEPEHVRGLHLEYIEAGARAIIINSYSASFTRMSKVDSVDQVPNLQRTACELALRARDAAGPVGAEVAVAGCLPPLNGSYRADQVRDYEVNLEEYRRLVALQAPHVDMFVCETMSTALEGKAAATAACETGKPVWVAWTLREDAPVLRSGEAIADAFAALDGLDVQVVLANCTSPESVSRAVPQLTACGLPAGGYANAFLPIPETFRPATTITQLSAREDLTPSAYGAFAMDWVDRGAVVVGGCCEVGPQHIAQLRELLEAGGNELVSTFALNWMALASDDRTR